MALCILIHKNASNLEEIQMVEAPDGLRGIRKEGRVAGGAKVLRKLGTFRPFLGCCRSDRLRASLLGSGTSVELKSLFPRGPNGGGIPQKVDRFGRDGAPPVHQTQMRLELFPELGAPLCLSARHPLSPNPLRRMISAKGTQKTNPRRVPPKE